MMNRRDLGVAVAVACCAGSAAWADGAFDLEPGTRVLAPIRFQQLAIFPVVKTAAAAIDPTRYLTLSDGLASKQVEVTEAVGGKQVNLVHVINHSDRPLLLLGGEVILGGQQDRVIGKDTILERRSDAELEVFCVEHGRWSGHDQFTQAGGLAEGKIRLRAKYRSDQGQVWDQVAKKNASLGAAPSTGTYRNLAAGAEGERAIKSYRDHFAAALAKLPEAKDLIGLVAAVNGRVNSVDVFAGPELFAAYRDKLLDSILVGAVDVAPTAAAATDPTAGDIQGFVGKARAAKPKQIASGKGGTTLSFDSAEVQGSTVKPNATKTPAYQSYQRNE